MVSTEHKGCTNRFNTERIQSKNFCSMCLFAYSVMQEHSFTVGDKVKRERAGTCDRFISSSRRDTKIIFQFVCTNSLSLPIDVSETSRFGTFIFTINKYGDTFDSSRQACKCQQTTWFWAAFSCNAIRKVWIQIWISIEYLLIGMSLMYVR